MDNYMTSIIKFTSYFGKDDRAQAYIYMNVVKIIVPLRVFGLQIFVYSVIN